MAEGSGLHLPTPSCISGESVEKPGVNPGPDPDGRWSLLSRSDADSLPASCCRVFIMVSPSYLHSSLPHVYSVFLLMDHISNSPWGFSGCGLKTEGRACTVRKCVVIGRRPRQAELKVCRVKEEVRVLLWLLDRTEAAQTVFQR